MAILCLFASLYCIILQVTILAKTIEVSYIDINQGGSAAGVSTDGSLMTQLSQTRFNPSFATSFRGATRSVAKSRTKAHQTYTTLNAMVTASSSQSHRPRDVPPPLVTVPPRIVPRKTLENNVPAGDVEASCLYYNGTSLPKR